MTTSTASPIQLAALTLSGLLAGNELGTLIGAVGNIPPYGGCPCGQR
jgi:hypothetical protein